MDESIRDVESIRRKAGADPLPPLFGLGRVGATPEAVMAAEEAGLDTNALFTRGAFATYLRRHQAGDWSECPEEDQGMNRSALDNGGHIIGTYHLPDGTKIWIVTEAEIVADGRPHRPLTTILLPEERQSTPST